MKLDITHDWCGKPLPRKEHVEVSLRTTSGGAEITIRAPFYGDPEPNGPVGALDGLWEFEVVEVFIAGLASPIPYTEIEMAPSGHHLVLTLQGVRQPTATCLPLEFRASVHSEHWEGTATIDARFLPPHPWHVNATAIHGVGEERKYASAVPLPGTTPDFHQPGIFVPFTN